MDVPKQSKLNKEKQETNANTKRKNKQEEPGRRGERDDPIIYPKKHWFCEKH